MKRTLLLSMLLLFAGAGMQAQSIANEQMDERFNEGTRFPRGWFGEGWKVENGKAKCKATEDSGNGFPGGGGFSPNQNENPSQPGMPGMGGMFGGDRKRTYLLTPPLSVRDGEKLVFSARKTNGDEEGGFPGGGGAGFNFDLKAIMGFTDTLFVVERSVYGKSQWVRVADFTNTLDDKFQTLTVTGTPKGQYRFRFISYVDAEIDSVAGFHIDNEAPDLMVTVDSLHTRFVDYSVCAEDSTKEFILINTGTGELKVNVTSDDSQLFSLDKSSFSIAAGDSAKLNVTFHYKAGKIGKNEALISFRPEDSRLSGSSITVAAVITDPEAWFVDFNDNKMPFGCFGEGFVVKEGIATHYNPAGGGMAAMAAIFGGGGASDWFMTPPLHIKGVNDAVIFSLKNGDGSYKGPIIDPQANVTIEKSVYGSNKWERVDAYQFKDTLYHTKWISWLPEGDYRFRFLSGDSLCIDSIAGGSILMNAPDLLVRHNGRAVQTVNYGVARGNHTKTFQLINTGTSTLQLYVMTSDPTFYTVNKQMVTIEAGEEAVIDVTFCHNPEALGAHQAALVLSPANCQIATQMIYLSAYITYGDAWSENFELEYEVEEGENPELPVDWETTGWLMTKGGGMDMMAMMGMGGGEKSWAPHTDSDAYELVTPQLQARQGDVLRFYADISSGWLNVFYKCGEDADWTYQTTYITADSIYVIAPLAGISQLKFTGRSVSGDDFLGFRKPIQGVALQDSNDEDNAAVFEYAKGKKVNVFYDRVLSAAQKADGTYTPQAYTLCLPYDFRFSELVAPGKVKFYQLSFVDDYYKQFVFTAVADVAWAGQAYVAVVDEGEVSLNAFNVTLVAEPVTDAERTAVNDYATWFFDDNLKKVGQWAGTFKAITADEAADKNMYCMLDDGTWARLTPEDNPNARLNAFRGYFTTVIDETEVAPVPRHVRAVADQPSPIFRTLFSNAGIANVGDTDGSVHDALSIIFEGDIPAPTPTAIQPVIQTVEADGTSRYFDVQGRMLNGKPQKGIYIENDRKVLR